MSGHEWYLGALRQHGYRATPQRATVLEALARHQGHLSVEDLYSLVRWQHPRIDLATVYRSVQLLTKLHLVAEIQGGPVARYELLRPEQQHHHMVCEECGAAFDLLPHYLNDLRDRLMEGVGFEPHMEHFTVSGLCQRCRSGHAAAHP